MAAKKDGNTKNKSGKKKRSKLFTIFLIFIDVIIIVAAFGAVFYFVFYNNIGGVTEKYYSTVKSIPLLNLALPEEPDPLNPKYMTQKEIRDKYIEFKNENEQLRNQLSEADTKTDELQSYKDDHDKLIGDAQAKIKELEQRESAIVEKERELAALQTNVDEMIVNGDMESFREYYESIDPENAAILYEAVINKQQTDENIKKFAQTYAEMDPAAAAVIFERLGSSKLDMITETLHAMKRESASEILESMTPDFAARVTEELNALYKGN